MGKLLSNLPAPQERGEGLWVRARISCAALVVLFVSAVLTPAAAQNAGGLMVAPTRVVLEGDARSAEVALVNQSSQEATYRILVVNQHMTEEGKLVEAKEPLAGELFADAFIRYAPRQVHLLPGASQTVRLTIRPPGDLADGEYRSHILFQSVPPKDTGTDLEALGPNELRVKIIPVYGVMIPFVYRRGALEAEAALFDVAATRSTLALKISRTGNRSVSGDLKVTDIATGKEVGVVRGIGVYPPLAFRKFEMALHPPVGFNLAGRRLRVEYSAPETEGGKLQSAAEAQVP